MGLDEEEDAKREKALWDWYLEWSEIARVKIKNRRALRSLGFLKPDGTPVQVEEEQPEDTETPIVPVEGGGPTPTGG